MIGESLKTNTTLTQLYLGGDELKNKIMYIQTMK